MQETLVKFNFIIDAVTDLAYDYQSLVAQVPTKANYAGPSTNVELITKTKIFDNLVVQIKKLFVFI